MGFKSFLYKALKYSNDINAVQQAAKKNSFKPIKNRIIRRGAGKMFGRAMGKLLK